MPNWWDSARGSPEPPPASPSALERANTLAGQHMRFAYAGNYPDAVHWLLWFLFWVATTASVVFCGDIALYVLGMGWLPDWLVPAYVVYTLSFALLLAALAASSWYYRNGKPYFQRERAIQSVDTLAKADPALRSYLETLDGMSLPRWWMYGIRRRTWFLRLRTGTLAFSAYGLAAVTFFFGWYGFWPTVPHRPQVDFGEVLFCLLSVALLAFLCRWMQIRLSPWRGADYRSRTTFALAVLRDDFLERFR